MRVLALDTTTRAGSVALVVLMFLFLQFKPVPGAQVGALAAALALLGVGEHHQLVEPPVAQ